MKKISQGFVIPLLIAVVTLLGIGGGVYVFMNKKTVDISVPKGVCSNGAHNYPHCNVGPGDKDGFSEVVLVGNDKDIHGCIGSAGYSWCEVKNKCLRSWEEKCEVPLAIDSKTFINKILNDIKLNERIEQISKKINFTTVNDTTINKDVVGYAFVTDGGLNISSYFMERGMTVDWNNSGDATSHDSIAYKNNNLICVVSQTILGRCIDTGKPITEDCYVLSVFCADL